MNNFYIAIQQWCILLNKGHIRCNLNQSSNVANNNFLYSLISLQSLNEEPDRNP